jgi:hypothetical protein
LKPCGVIKKKREIRIREGVSPPLCPTPGKIFFGQGFGEGTLNPYYFWIVSIPTGVAKAAGHEPRERGLISERPEVARNYQSISTEREVQNLWYGPGVFLKYLDVWNIT